MKQFHIAILLFFFAISMSAQNLQDILRYSTPSLSGTARYISMGGAFGALGGDLSALNDNPAASSVFEFSQMSVSLRGIRNNNRSTYIGTPFESNYNHSLFDQIGFTLIFKDDESPWSKISASFNSQKVSDFENNFIAKGNNNNGIDSYFLGFAQGNELKDFELLGSETVSDLYIFLTEEGNAGADEGLLGYQSYLINPNTNNATNTQYSSAVAPGSGGYYHEYSTRTRGGINKYNFNFSAVYLKKLHLGINLNSHTLLYEESKNFIENNYSSTSPLTLFNFDNDFKATGRGFSFQIGGIAKINKHLRLGASFESPTWFRVREELSQSVYNQGTNGLVNVDPDVVKVYPAYRFNTPSKYTGSFAYIFGLKGLISIDYTIVDYKSAKFNEPNDAFLNNQNNIIGQQLKTAGVLKVGGEYRFGKLSFRAGYLKQEASLINFDNSTEIRSAGVGINLDGHILDFSVSRAQINGQQAAFSSGLTDNINLRTNRLNLGLTYTLKF